MLQKVGPSASKLAMLKDGAFRWNDPLDLEGEFAEEERMVRDTALGLQSTLQRGRAQTGIQAFF